MRVAICLSGEMRGCDDCLRLLEERVIRPFRDAGAETVDLFCHTRKDPWWMGAVKLPFRCLWVEENRRRDDSLIVSQANPRERGDYEPSGTNDRRGFLYQSYLQQYWSQQAVGQMLKRAEEQDGVTYDWVVRSRPDVHLEAPLPVAKLDPTVVSCPWNDWWPYEVSGKRVETVTDKFAVGPSLAMQHYLFKLWDLREFCQQYRLQGEWFTAWQMNLRGVEWCRHDGIKVVQSDLLYQHSLRPDRES